MTVLRATRQLVTLLRFRSNSQLTRRAFATATALQKTVPSALVVGEVRDGSLTPGTLSAVTFGRSVVGYAGRVELLLDSSSDTTLPKVPRLEAVFTGDFGDGVAERVTDGLLDVLKTSDRSYSWIIGDGGSFGKNVMARAAGKLGLMGIADVVGVDKVVDVPGEEVEVDSYHYRRFIYAGAALQTVKVKGSKMGVFTVRGAGFDRAEICGPWEKEVVQVDSKSEDERAKIVEQSQKGDGVELGSARTVIAGGRGLKSESHFKMLDDLGQCFESAAIGATRAAVDSGWCPNDMQVGQTGKIVAPELYIGIGVSGAIQHLAGMRESKCIVAINKDRKAPIFQVSDYGLVGDLFDIIPELTKKLKNSEHSVQ